MGWIFPVSKLSFDPKIPSLHPLICQKRFDLKNHTKWRKAFPESCPLKIKDCGAVPLIKWTRGDIQNWELLAEYSYLPKKNNLVFPREILFTTVARIRTQVKSPRASHIYVPLCTFHRTDQETHWNVCVCLKEMDGSAVRGTSGTWHWHGEASPFSHPPFLLHTSLHISFIISFPEPAALRCNGEETRALSTRRLYVTGGYFH